MSQVDDTHVQPFVITESEDSPAPALGPRDTQQMRRLDLARPASPNPSARQPYIAPGKLTEPAVAETNSEAGVPPASLENSVQPSLVRPSKRADEFMMLLMKQQEQSLRNSADQRLIYDMERAVLEADVSQLSDILASFDDRPLAASHIMETVVADMNRLGVDGRWYVEQTEQESIGYLQFYPGSALITFSTQGKVYASQTMLIPLPEDIHMDGASFLQGTVPVEPYAVAHAMKEIAGQNMTRLASN